MAKTEKRITTESQLTLFTQRSNLTIQKKKG